MPLAWVKYLLYAAKAATGTEMVSAPVEVPLTGCLDGV